jgi:uncharacterized membrane protein
MKSPRSFARDAAWWLLLALSAGVAAYASLVLFRPATIDFLTARTDWLHEALVLHAVAGAIALLLGPLQLSGHLRARRTELHRFAGRVYVGAVLLAGLSGLVLAPSTRGGLQAQTGFVLLSVLWLVSTGVALRAVLSGNLAAHRAWMLRSFAFTFSAVTLRILLGLGIASGIRFVEIYALAAWLSWVPNLIIVEWIWISRQTPSPMYSRPSPRGA